MNNIKKYKPDFCDEQWTEKDLYYLEPFASNPKGLISVLRNLPPELTGALCSRASRASGSLFRVLLKEYIYPILDGEDKNLALELEETINFLRKGGFKNVVNNKRAQAFYAKWLSQYGDDSIAQMTGTHIIMRGISQVAIKFVEDRRIGLEPIEQSTRYVNFGNKTNGKYSYCTPIDELESIGLLEEYKQTLDLLFDTYVELLPPFIEWLKQNFDDKESILEKKAFDTLRGLLPMATLGQVAFRGNAQAFEYLINRSASHNLGEIRWIADTLREELNSEIPSLLLRSEGEQSKFYQQELGEQSERTHKTVSEIFSDAVSESSGKPVVNLIEFDVSALDKIIAGIVFPETHLSWNAIMQKVKNMSDEEKERILSAYVGNRKERWQKMGRAFENSYVRFEIEMNIGAYRDLHRHRMMTQERQRFSTHLGYDIPEELRDSGLSDKFEEAMGKAKVLFEKIEQYSADLAQYVVPLAYRIRFYEWQNIRQFFWETELRTISQGHPDYRFIEQEKFRLLKDKLPMILKYARVDMNDYKIARRGTEEKITAREKEIIEGLQTKD